MRILSTIKRPGKTMKHAGEDLRGRIYDLREFAIISSPAKRL